jgi:4-oxalocrotonate tautomerase
MDFQHRIRSLIMPIVNIKIAKGRSLEQKRLLVRSVTDAIAAAIDVPPEIIWIQIDEFERENFSVNGRLMADKDP